jgi:3-oxoacyl-(acyl-carrier-protein) synthase
LHHLLQRAGGVEGGFIPPNVGMSEIIDEAVYQTPMTATQAEIRNALCASFAFGGHNSVLAMAATDNM